MDKKSKVSTSEDVELSKVIDKEFYGYLGKANGYSLNQLNCDIKENSFIKTTFPQAKIVNFLGLFKGMFTEKHLKMFYYEALFILEQSYKVLKKTMMINEVISLGLAILNFGMFPQMEVLSNTVQIISEGIY